MQWNSNLSTVRIDCASADLIDDLYANALPAPCAAHPSEVWQWLCTNYPVIGIPKSDRSYCKTAVAVLEMYFPEEAEYLPEDFDERLEAVRMYDSVMQLHCGIIENKGSGAVLYEDQKREFEARAGRFGLVWKPMPITVCMEFNSGYRLINGSQILSDLLTVQCGVSEYDITQRTPELLAYLRAKHALDD